MTTRRALLQAAVAAGVLTTMGRKVSAQGGLNILVLGGTGFIGPHLVQHALDRGHQVTLFNRGITRPELFPEVEKLRGTRAVDGGDLRALHGKRRWDAVVDVWPARSALVEQTAALLSERTDYYFFVSSIIAGLSMVIFESTLSHRFFKHKMDETHLAEKDTIALGFGKAASFVLAGYFIVKVIGISADNNWHYLGTGYGTWYLVELLGFVALPCFLYAVGVRDKNVTLIKWTAAWTVLGVVINRFNVSMIAFNWHLPANERYFPHWMEIGISVFIVTVGIIIFRFIVTRMPILYEHPDYKGAH